MSLEVVWKFFGGMNDGKDGFLQGKVSNLGFLKGFIDIINRLLGSFINSYQDQTYCM